MKKLIFAGAFALATLTACNNSEGQINSEEQQHQTFASKTTARGEEVVDEKATNEAIEIIKKDATVGGGTDSRILCHTPYNQPKGHACVSVGNYIVNVEWYSTPESSAGSTTYYFSEIVSSCRC